MRDLKLSLTPWSNMWSKMGECSVDDIEDGVCVQSTDTVRKALAEEMFENSKNAIVSQKERMVLKRGKI